jgi:hypothetical protein
MATPAEEIRAESYVGFDSITQQIEHKLLKRGFQFNVILVGAFWFSYPVMCLAAHFFSLWVMFSSCYVYVFFFRVFCYFFSTFDFDWNWCYYAGWVLNGNPKAKLDWESRHSSTPFLRRT